MQASVVARSQHSHQPEALRQSIERALAPDRTTAFPCLIRPGDRSVSPTCATGRCTLETNMISQPAIIAGDRPGARLRWHPMLGDEGSGDDCGRPSRPRRNADNSAGRTGRCRARSFAKAGGARAQRHSAPHQYLLSRAALDADVVINLGQRRAPSQLVWSGAVKNMFNTVIGAGNAQLFEIAAERRAQRPLAADPVLAVTPPHRVPVHDHRVPGPEGRPGASAPIGASTDPSPSTASPSAPPGPGPCGDRPPGPGGQWLGFGPPGAAVHRPARAVPGATSPVPRPAPHDSGPSPRGLAAEGAAPQQDDAAPAPAHRRWHCNGCADCIRICPIGAISAGAGGRLVIDQPPAAWIVAGTELHQARDHLAPAAAVALRPGGPAPLARRSPAAQQDRLRGARPVPSPAPAAEEVAAGAPAAPRATPTPTRKREVAMSTPGHAARSPAREGGVALIVGSAWAGRVAGLPLRPRGNGHRPSCRPGRPTPGGARGPGE